MHRDAKLSDDGTYRYLLHREWNGARQMAAVCMLNPSSADASVDDPTIRALYRLLGAPKAVHVTSNEPHRSTYGGFVVINLFAYRSANPKALITAKNAIGPDNAEAWIWALGECEDVIFAWGAASQICRHRRFKHVLSAQEAAIKKAADKRGRRTMCFGLTSLGKPRHPLYLLSDTRLEPYDAR